LAPFPGAGAAAFVATFGAVPLGDALVVDVPATGVLGASFVAEAPFEAVPAGALASHAGGADDGLLGALLAEPACAGFGVLAETLVALVPCDGVDLAGIETVVCC
jgi:hypothetical protein